MRTVARKLWNDEAGVIISAELVLILTIVVIGVVVGLVQVRQAVVAEFQDLSLAFSHLNQSYGFTGFHGGWKWWGPTSWTAGSSFVDLYEGTAIGGVADFGGFGARGGFVEGGGFYGGGGGFAYGYGFGGAVAGRAVFGTIILSDGVLIPIRLIASGTWELPGGYILAASSSQAHVLLLAGGGTVSFVYGAPAIIVLADGTTLAARPGINGNLILADGRVIVIDTTKENSGTLADGTVVTIRWAAANFIILADGTTIEVRSGVAGTLVLVDGRIIKLTDAILPEGYDAQPIPQLDMPVRPLPQGEILPGQPLPRGEFLPGQPLGPEGRLLPGQPGLQFVPGGEGFRTAPPIHDIHPHPGVDPNCCGDLGPHGQPLTRPRLKPEIPQGPAPQYSPQL